MLQETQFNFSPATAMSESDSFVDDESSSIDESVQSNASVDASDEDGDESRLLSESISDDDDTSICSNQPSPSDNAPKRKRLIKRSERKSESAVVRGMSVSDVPRRRSKRLAATSVDVEADSLPEDSTDDEDTEEADGDANESVIAQRRSFVSAGASRRQLLQQQRVDNEMGNVRIVGRSGEHKFLSLLLAVMYPEDEESLKEETELGKEDRLYKIFVEEFQNQIYYPISFGNFGEYYLQARELALDFNLRVCEAEPHRDFCVLCQRHTPVNSKLVSGSRLVGYLNKKCRKRFEFLRRVNLLRAKIGTFVLYVKQSKRTNQFSGYRKENLEKKAIALAQQCLNYSNISPSMGNGKAVY